MPGLVTELSWPGTGGLFSLRDEKRPRRTRAGTGCSAPPQPIWFPGGTFGGIACYWPDI